MDAFDPTALDRGDQGGMGIQSPVLANLSAKAGTTRFRPVIMTALAMIIGMVPMALGLGDGGEQNAPLGRAVIGGLFCATVATLVFVPSVFALFHKNSHPASSKSPETSGVNSSLITEPQS
jgi:Cu/Ag efflux pump CusA